MELVTNITSIDEVVSHLDDPTPFTNRDREMLREVHEFTSEFMLKLNSFNPENLPPMVRRMFGL